MAEIYRFHGYPGVNESRESRELLHFFYGSETTKGAGLPAPFAVGF
jgi:hypothetical protein